jgi:uncharacterized membrane protein YraQ (UPF0718 family)
MTMEDHLTSCGCGGSGCPEQAPAARVCAPFPWRTASIGVLVLVAWVLLYQYLAPIAHWLTYTALPFQAQTHLGSTVEFFLFEVPKVLLLLTLVVFGVGIVRSFFTPERTRRILAGKRESVGNVLAALLGIVTPFCSCSAVPLFIGFVTTGISSIAFRPTSLFAQ